MKKSIGIIGAAALGLGMALSAASAAGAAGAGTIYVPDDFNPVLHDTRATGHYELQGTGLHVWTEGSTSTDKVAEYVDTTTPLSAVIGEPSLEQRNIGAGTIAPGYQLVIDFDGDGTPDGILVGEPTAYGNDWWASNGSAQFVKDGAPSHTGGFGSDNHGTLAQWSAQFPNAVVKAFGFSLGSGVLGDWVIDAINFNGTRYTFAQHVTLTSKEQCYGGGWTAANTPAYRNQGECVSSFASKKKASAYSI